MGCLNRILSVSLLALIVFSSCKKKGSDDMGPAPAVPPTDTIPPVITLIGNAVVDHILNDTYNDPGAIAVDDTDGDLTALVVTINSVDKDLVGAYIVTYSVSDAAGNTATAVRNVNVYNQADIYDDNYGVNIVCPGLPNYNYTESISSSNTTNRRIIFSKFGDYTVPSGTKIFADVNPVAGTVIIPSQTIQNAGTPPSNVDRTFSGTGTIIQVGGVTTITLTVTESTAAGSSVCTYNYTSL